MFIPDEYGIAAFKYTNPTNDEVAVTTIGFHNTTVDTADVVALILSGSCWLVGFDDSQWSDEWIYMGCYVLINIGGVHQAFETTDNIVGTNTNNPEPPAVAVGIKKQTSYAGKQYRGRMYLPSAFVSEVNVSGTGTIDSGIVTAIQSSIDDVAAQMAFQGYPPYLLHTDPLIAPTPINSFLVRNSVRTQRRRQKHG